MGATPEIQLQRFLEALKDPKAGLTYSAMTGIRKQSVEDVEQLLGAGMVDFMENKGYDAEALYIKVFHNWRRAVDERGLTLEQRCKFRDDLLKYLLGDWMPWHSTQHVPDFSLLEVNRYTKCTVYVDIVCEYVYTVRVKSKD